jgi:hypothetical protein
MNFKNVLNLIIVFSTVSATEPLNLVENGNNSVGSKLCTIGFILPAFAITVAHHEVGHTLFAKALGDPGAHIKVYKPESVININKLSHFGKIAVPLAGVFFSELLAEGYDRINENVEMPDLLHRLLAVGYLVTKLDIGLQTYQILGKHEVGTFDGPPEERTDFVDFTFNISNGSKKYLTLSQIGFCSMFTIDVALSLEKFRRTGKSPRERKNFPGGINTRIRLRIIDCTRGCPGQVRK